MARGNSRAQSEAGTIERSKTANYRIKAATELLKNLTTGGINRENADLAEQVLNRPRSNETEYDVNLGMQMAVAGKLNLMDATIDGKEIAQRREGAFDKTTVARRGSPESERDFRYEADKLQRQEGFVFATDEKGQLFAIPHTWDVNDPQGTVGFFKGDRITYTDANSREDRTLNVIGSFDNSKRGLNLAAAAAGDALGRSMGVKQTAILLGSKTDAKEMTNQRRGSDAAYSGWIRQDVVNDLNNDREQGGLRTNHQITKRVG